MPTSSRYNSKLYNATAAKWDVDPNRVLVWHLFSNFYLDNEVMPDERTEMIEALVSLPFSVAELAHIAYYEVNLVCAANLFSLAGEWSGFDNDWLIPKCKKLMLEKPFKSSTQDNKVPHFPWQEFVFTYYQSLFLIMRVQKIRQTMQHE